MNEQELRDFILNLASRYIGCVTGDSAEREIVDAYNGHKPLPRGYEMKYTDNWCQCFVSAIGIMANLADIVPIECGCGEAVQIAQKMGIWHDRDFTPQKGDIVMYDWESKKDGWADHTGFVEVVGENYINTVEGNCTGGVCARRIVMLNDPTILGYITPDYASKATNNPKPDIMYADYFDPSIAGVYKTTTALYLRKGAGIGYKAIAVMPKGAEVRNYGYYSLSAKTPWFYVKYNDIVGFCSSRYLKRD